jgi:hypothetical protein
MDKKAPGETKNNFSRKREDHDFGVLHRGISVVSERFRRRDRKRKIDPPQSRQTKNETMGSVDLVGRLSRDKNSCDWERSAPSSYWGADKRLGAF